MSKITSVLCEGKIVDLNESEYTLRKGSIYGKYAFLNVDYYGREMFHIQDLRSGLEVNFESGFRVISVKDVNEFKSFEIRLGKCKFSLPTQGVQIIQFSSGSIKFQGFYVVIDIATEDIIFIARVGSWFSKSIDFSNIVFIHPSYQDLREYIFFTHQNNMETGGRFTLCLKKLRSY